MTQNIRSLSEIQGVPQREQPVLEEFDYTSLPGDVAEQVQTAAQRIRAMVKQTLSSAITIGTELLEVKKRLGHGRFGLWLRTEFGWTDRTARYYMTVARRLGSKTETVSDLPIDPKAAYLLAAPSAPEEATEAAVQRALSGETITVSIARQILHHLRTKSQRKPARRPRRATTKTLRGELLVVLEEFRQRWDPDQVSLLARQLTEFAASLQEK